MAKLRVEGSFVAVITPFNRDGTVDHEGFRTNLAIQEEHGTAAVLILGSTGEVSLLSREERHDIIRKTVMMRRGAMKFFYGCTANNTAETIAMVKFAAKEGADGAILAAPSYIAASEADIERYFLEVADATDLPLGVYNNPPRVKTDLPVDSLLRIFQHPNFVVHKESTTRVAQVAQLLAARPDVSVMCCDSPNLGLVVPTMALGGHGTANMTGNLAPAEMALMRALGLPAGDLRRPLTGLDERAVAAGLDIIAKLGLHERYGYNINANDAAPHRRIVELR